MSTDNRAVGRERQMSTIKVVLLGVVVFGAAVAYPFVAQHVHDALGHEKRVELWLAAIFVATVWRRK